MIAHNLRSLAPLALALGAGLAFTPQKARALNVDYNGTTYDLRIYTGSYDSNPSIFATPANGGSMPWWGNSGLANGLSAELAGSLSPFPYPEMGPLFATSFVSSSSGAEINASYFDLTSLGVTDVVASGSFGRTSVNAYVYNYLDPVPAPLPIAATAVCFSATRRLRRLTASLRRHRSLMESGQGRQLG